MVFLILGLILKDVIIIDFKDSKRISLSFDKPATFYFSADEEKISLIFDENIKNQKENENILVVGNEIIISGKYEYVEWFVIPFPYKIILDIGKKAKEIEEIIGRREREKVIVIDPGHGGEDVGTKYKIKYKTKYKNIYEKDITLKISKEIKKILEKKFEVILTREEDKFLDLETRSGIANASQCDVFISIHVNSHKNKNISGTEIFYFSPEKKKYALYVASKENGFKLEGDYIKLFKKVEKTKIKKSIKLAHMIGKEMKNIRRIEGAPLYVITGTMCPAILIEVGFITNKKDREIILTKWKNIAKNIAKGIEKFLKM